MNMGNIKFIKTDDGSTGLYDEDVKDIYHSKTGALKEAYDKFILPSGIKKLAEKNESLSILDVCYGIGYNTKAALNSVSRRIKINIDCLENNIELINISPFIIDKIDNADLKIKLFEEILNINSNSPEFVINNLKKYLKDNINFFAPSLMLFIEHLISEGYIYSGQDINRSFLHNIYFFYMPFRYSEQKCMSIFNISYLKLIS